MQSENHEVLPIAGFPVRCFSRERLADALLQAMDQAQQIFLCFANTNSIVKCRTLRSRLDAPDVIIVNDGIGLDIASRLVHGRRFPENLNGTDFTPFFLSRYAGRRVFLLGGAPGCARAAGDVLRAKCGAEVVGCCDGYAEMGASGELIQRINASGAEVILVALGNPLQETWILDNMGQLDARLFIAVGALFDFLAGNVRRAPEWVRKMRCEWLFRLCQEPQRLLRRYTIEVVQFFCLALMDKGIATTASRKGALPSGKEDRSNKSVSEIQN